jgi:hypothetical protein
MTTPESTDVTGSNSGGNRMPVNRTPTSRGITNHPVVPNNPARQGTTRRPVTRSTTRVGSATRGLPNLRRSRNRSIPVIEIETSSDED